MKPIYKPTGKAKEYGDYAINIYMGCPHRCYYCFAPNVLRRDKEEFHSHVEPRKDIVSEVAKQLEREKITGKLIHLCFTCDPYPTGYDTTATREIIRSLKQSGNLDDCFDMFDKVKIGKLNYYPSDIHWPSFGEAAEKICKRRGLDYYIKDSLRAEMEVDNG